MKMPQTTYTGGGAFLGVPVQVLHDFTRALARAIRDDGINLHGLYTGFTRAKLTLARAHTHYIGVCPV